MIDIIVQRGLGDSPGEDIEDPLIVDVMTAVERGRNEIDAASGLRTVSLSCVINPAVRLGMTVAVHDALQGKVWQGKVTSIRHSIQESGAITDLGLLRNPE